MSRAFVKNDNDGGNGNDLPDRTVSAHPNYVTPRGLALIESELARLQDEQARVADDLVEQASIARDLRYWRARRASVQPIEPVENPDHVQFGVSVTIRREDGREQTFKLVGEDEADPAHGTLPYVAPLARALMGKTVGDVVQVSGAEAEIVRIA